MAVGIRNQIGGTLTGSDLACHGNRGCVLIPEEVGDIGRREFPASDAAGIPQLPPGPACSRAHPLPVTGKIAF